MATIVIGSCPACKSYITGFKDKASYKEFRQSGLCQNCQDEVFGGAYTCEYCSKEVANKEAGYLVEQHFYCSYECYGHDVGF